MGNSVTNAVELSSSINKSGRQTVCHDETVVYSCSTINYLEWNIDPPGGKSRSTTFSFYPQDITTERRFKNNGQYYALLQITAGMNLSSMLVIPYTTELNGTRILCKNGNNENETLFYTIAGKEPTVMIFQYNNYSVTNVVELSSSINKSGRQTVCHDETVVYSCSTINYLEWNIDPPGGQPRPSPFIFYPHDITTERQFKNKGQYYALLQITAGMNLSSMLVIPYTTELNGTRVLCKNGNNENETLFYTIAGKETTMMIFQYNNYYSKLHSMP